MTKPQTEALHQASEGLDALPLPDIAQILAESQIAAAEAVHKAIPEISKAAEHMALTLKSGGVLHYVAAGSSGLMAAADAQELGGTFSIPPAQLRIHMAGGLPTGVEMPGDTEDDTAGLATTLSALTDKDSVIAVSASGETPFTLAAAEIAQAAGASVISIANNPDTTLLRLADVAICIPTPPEVLSGSTRMGAGTAQKIALNMMSTLMAVALGHVHDGMMVNLFADNAKLRKRAADIVAHIAEVDTDIATAALKATDGAVKPAVLLARGQDPEAAKALLIETENNLRAALARIT
jgi:N-acetylmuramic acid 6-phosphate etherase